MYKIVIAVIVLIILWFKAISIIPSLQGYDPNDYARRLAEKWRIGQKGKDNGTRILLKSKSGNEKGQVTIALGYGLEGVVPDAIASRIIRNEMLPPFSTMELLLGNQPGDKCADGFIRRRNGWLWRIRTRNYGDG